MVGSSAFGTFRWLSRSSKGFLSGAEATTQKCLSRSISTETAGNNPQYLSREELLKKWAPKPVLATTYSFPTMEPVKFVEYQRDHLMMPLRRDILHRAVIYEGDSTRQGSASTKWRKDVHGSNKKLFAQKGTGRARAGDKKSPIRRGGGVAFGPHPRDFSSSLPVKIYDKAWRIALSYRYKRGQLIIIDDKIGIPEGATTHFIKEMFQINRWGREFGRSTLITERPDEELFATVGQLGHHAKILDRQDVDVKDLLETGRLIVEKKALDLILQTHSRDLTGEPAKAIYDY
ncbi:ribosomal protein L4 domain-containing protein [Aspergillus karnatakaensis]|uniref:mitochondrial 54S ribosomal protein uL4m n=1 Tax=Aspergillus karnatakaensis TaxID=1810916 RepID=UPI003CCD2C64